MTRQSIILGDYKYILELYKNSEDFSMVHKKNFYMIKNFDILLESITEDKDIYFIEKDNTDIVYPITNTNNVAYSVNINEFNSNINETNIDLLKYNFYSSSLEEISIPCDLLRIYLPTVKANLCAILDVNNIINGIKFHYLIKDINTEEDNSEIKSELEFEYDHQIYSQYIDVYIPSINYLISNQIYIKEYNLTDFEYLDIDTNKEYVPFTSLFKKFSIEKDKSNYPRIPKIILNSSSRLNVGNSASDITIKYSIEDEIVEDGSNIIYYKKFINTKIFNEFYNILNVSLYPYTDIDENGIFIPNADYPLNNEIFYEDLTFSLSSELRFPRVDDVVKLYENEEEYSTGYDIEENNLNNSSFGSSSSSFEENEEEVIDPKLEEFNKIEGFPCIITKFKYKDLLKNNSILDNYFLYSGTNISDYKEFDSEDISEEYDIEENIKTTGFLIEIASDNKFKNILYKYSVLIPEESIIDNLIFPINSIFTSWDNYPEILIVRIRFIDKVASQIIESNPVIITKEWFKYLLNDSSKRRIHFNKVYFNKNNLETNMVTQLNYDGFNFIDKINCTIVKEGDSSVVNTVSKNPSPKVIYKPIFYKVVDLQNITIIPNIKQNIGINLSEYFGKVETFKLVLDNVEYVENGRNDIYVIFSIAASKIKQTTGKYYVLNENSELISTGNYIIG